MLFLVKIRIYMDESKILERLRYSLRKNDVLNLMDIFSKNPKGIDILIDLCSNSNNTLGFHAAWVLEHMIIDKPELLKKYFVSIVNKMPETKNPSVQRHFSKIAKCSLESGAVKDFIATKKNSKSIELLIEVCFEWLLNLKTPIAVKAYCMDILVYLAPSNTWIKEELPHVIRLNMIDASPGISAKSKKILAQLSNHEAS